MFLTHLECTNCGTTHDWEKLQNLCPKCQKPLFSVYDLEAVGKKLKKEDLAAREKSLWRFREVLPLPMEAEPVTLGEGGTPLLRAPRFGKTAGVSNLWVKDEAQTRRKVSRRGG
jgi:threonine synthase